MTCLATSFKGFSAATKLGSVRAPALRIALVAIALWVLPACGKRGDPLPPFRRVPAAAQGFQIRQSGDELALRWTSPAANTDGTVEDVSLVEVEIHRRIVDYQPILEETVAAATTSALEKAVRDANRLLSEPSDPDDLDEAAGADEEESEPTESELDVPGDAGPDVSESEPESATEPQAKDAAEGAEDAELGEADVELEPEPAPTPVAAPDFLVDSEIVETVPSVELSSELDWSEPIDPEWMGKRVEYAVRYVNRKNRPGPFTPVLQVEPIDPVETPSSLSVEVREAGVDVHWTAVFPEELPEILETGVQLYRRLGEEELYPTMPLNAVLNVEGVYRDTSMQFGEEYCYSVRQAVAPLAPAVEAPALPGLVDGVLDDPRNPLDSPDARDALDTLNRNDAGELRDVIEREAAANLPTEARQTPETTLAEPQGIENELSEEQAAELEAFYALPVTQESLPEGVELPEGLSLSQGELVELVPEFVIPPVPNPFLYESEPSEEVCVTPEDRFPPPRVTDLVAVVVNQSVLLSWIEVSDPAFGGYRVYRSRERPGEFELITDALLPSATFRDERPGPGVFFYYVSSVDSSPASNESERSNIVEVSLDAAP